MTLPTVHYTHFREQRVLDYVNRLRKKYKIGPPLQRMPRGVPEDGSRCPIATALKHKAYVETELIVFMRDDDTAWDEVVEPAYVSKFINDFDAGKYPHLEKSE